MKLQINENELKESIQLIHINAGTDITIPLIKRALVMARTNKDYAKFFLDKYYISVAYQKDENVIFSHNIKDLQFQRELDVLERKGYNLDKYSYFICRWLNKIRNNPYYKKFN